MKKISLIMFLCCAFLSSEAQNVKIIKKQELVQIMQTGGTKCVINFWATWCLPCVHEMPLFVKADSLYGADVEFVFVSFDFVEDSNRVKNMIHKLQIPGEQYILDESDMNELINNIDSNWSGTLPATWFKSALGVHGYYKDFVQFDDISKEIQSLIAVRNDEE